MIVKLLIKISARNGCSLARHLYTKDIKMCANVPLRSFNGYFKVIVIKTVINSQSGLIIEKYVFQYLKEGKIIL